MLPSLAEEAPSLPRLTDGFKVNLGSNAVENRERFLCRHIFIRLSSYIQLVPEIGGVVVGFRYLLSIRHARVHVQGFRSLLWNLECP